METARAISDVVSTGSFFGEYIPRHCAANGLDAAPFMNPDAVPDAAVCPHCGALLPYPKLTGPDGEFWGWRPIPEPCQNPRCRKLEAEAEKRRKRNERMAKLPELIARSGVPAGYRDKTTRNYSAANPILAEARQLVLEYIGWLNGDLPSGGLYLTGGVGTGKTHLAVAIARGALWYGHTVQFTSTISLMRAIKREMDGGDMESLMRRYENTGLLVLDDIGKEYATPWALSQLSDIIGARYAAERPVVYTSNYALDGNSGLAQALAQQGGLDSAEAIVSRIKGSTQVVKMLGEDWRRK